MIKKEDLEHRLQDTLFTAMEATKRGPMPLTFDPSMLTSGENPLDVEFETIPDWEVRMAACEMAMALVTRCSKDDGICF